MSYNNPLNNHPDDTQHHPENNPGTQTEIPITEEGNTPANEEYRTTGQESY